MVLLGFCECFRRVVGVDFCKEVLTGIEEGVENDGFEFGIEDIFSFFHFLFEEHGPFDFFRVSLFKRLEFRFDEFMAISPPNKHIFNGVSLLFFYFAIWCIEHSIISLIISEEFFLGLVYFSLFFEFIVEAGSWGFVRGFEFNVSVGLNCMLFNFSLFEPHHF